jgi:hypothetical protein
MRSETQAARRPRDTWIVRLGAAGLVVLALATVSQAQTESPPEAAPPAALERAAAAAAADAALAALEAMTRVTCSSTSAQRSHCPGTPRSPTATVSSG